MKTNLTALLILLSVLVLSCSHHRKHKHEIVDQSALKQVNLRNHISQWSESARSATEEMLNRYGPPHEMNENSLVWVSPGPFKRAVIYREGIYHAFPAPHTDVLEETIDYKVPLNKVSALWAFDGSLLLDRTRGELSARCDQEAMNILALNLADEIVRGKLTVMGARDEYKQAALSLASGSQPKFSSQISFSPGINTADPDENINRAKAKKRSHIQAQEARK